MMCMSFGTTANLQALYNAIKKADDAGILLIASAGNNETIEYPAKYEEVVAVGSINAEGELSEQSASGDELEVVAPGEQIFIEVYCRKCYNGCWQNCLI